MDEQTEFYYTIYPHVVNTLKAEGIDSRWADIVASQMMQESNWGRSSSAKENNFFGMKAGKNQSGTVYNTREGYGRNQKRINDKFLSFPSMEEGIRQGVIRLRDKFGAFEGTPSEEQFIKNINSTPGQIYFTEDPALYLHNLKTINRGKRANTARERYRQDLAPHYVTPIPIYKETLMDRMKKTAYPIKEFFSKGGHLASPWDNLSIREKAEMMRVAVRNGITNLSDIKQKYNEFAEGGEIESPVENSNIYAGGSYLDIAKQHIKKNEGWLAKPYRDAPKGKNWRSVGYGFNDSGFRNKYPQGISKHYENGITKAQAEEELNWFLGGVVNHLKKVYGRKWDSFNDNQKAAIIDTYYQRPASVVGKGSQFYRAVMAGDKNAGNYLGVAGYGNRNKDRRKLFGASQIESVAPTQEVLPISEPVQSMPEDTVDFIPWNPQAFFGVNNNTPIIIQQEAPVVEEKMPTPEEIERQERQQGLANFQTIMGMLNNTSNSTSTALTPFESTVSMLTQRSPIHYFSDRGSIRIKPENRGKFTRLKEKTGHSEGDNTNGPKFKESQEAYYDKDTDTIYAPDSTGEFYHHEMFHARPNSIELERLKPYYENLDDNRLLELGADLPFIKRIDNDPGHFYSPEEVGARVSAAKYMLNNARINKVDNIFLEEARKNENAYGNNFRDLLHMYNDDNLIGIFNNSYSSGGKIYIKPSHRGRFTALKERTGHSASWFKENGTPAQKKMATFALNSRHWKHGLGGNLFEGGGDTGGVTSPNVLPEVVVTGYRPIELRTYYPLNSDYLVGHSELTIPITSKASDELGFNNILNDSPKIVVSKTTNAKDYNLVTNNCADSTLSFLNAMYGTNESPTLFTTPGDVRDFAIEKLHGAHSKDRDGIDIVRIPRNAKNAERLSQKAINQFLKVNDEETAFIDVDRMRAYGGNLFKDGGTKAGIPVDYLDPSEVMPLVADNMGKSIVLDEQVVTPYKKLPMQSDFFEGKTNQVANEKADEFVNKTIGNGEAFTPWGLSGLLINEGMGAIASALPESAQEVLAKGRYISPSYWIDRGTGLSDEQLMNGKGKLFGTGTGTMFDILSTKGIGKGANAAATEAANTFSKIRQLSRLEKNYTGVPHKELREAPGTYMDEVFPNNHTQHTIWSTDDIDYPRTFDGPDRTIYDVYTDPKELSILETPSIPEDKAVYWQGLPFKLENGKVSFADNLSSERAGIPRSKDISLKKGGIGGDYTTDEVAPYIMKDGENGIIQNWKEAPGTISTDDVVKYSLDNGYDATKFNRVFDGASEIDGTLYDYPINELVLNPNTPRYVLPHGTSKLRLWNQLPTRYSQSNYFASKLPYTTLFRNYINNE